jgi:hypothetical protein
MSKKIVVGIAARVRIFVQGEEHSYGDYYNKEPRGYGPSVQWMEKLLKMRDKIFVGVFTDIPLYVLQIAVAEGRIKWEEVVIYDGSLDKPLFMDKTGNIVPHWPKVLTDPVFKFHARLQAAQHKKLHRSR